MINKKDLRRHKFIYNVIHSLVSPFLLKKYHYRTDIMKKNEYDGNYIIMANHATESDMTMMIRAFSKHMYFVCGEHLKRNKNAKLIWRFFDPIPEFKGSPAVATVREIITRARAGFNVMIFPEGSRSFNGETEPVSVATGKMVKVAGCGLITYRIHGGYFIAPRWAYHFRKGPASGERIGVYSAEEISQMSAEQITEIINRDLFENAYARQRECMETFAGEKLAEGLENYLEICPECGAYDSMETHDDTFRCTCCNKGGIYTPQGFLEGDGLRFDSVYDWGEWMKGQFVSDMQKRFAEEPADEPLFSDSNINAYEIASDHTLQNQSSGTLTVYRDRLVFNDTVYEFSNIPMMSMLYYGKTLLFDYDKKHLGFTGEAFHAWKYNSLHTLYLRTKNESRTIA